MFDSGQTFQIVGRTYQVKRRQRKRNKKEGEKTMGWGGGGNRKKRKEKKEERKKGKRKKKEVNERKGEGRGEEDRMKNRKENIVGIKYLNKRKYCVGTEPSALVYIGILVTSTTTGHDGSVVSALASEAKGRGSIPSCGTSFFFPQIFSIFPFQPPSSK